MQNSTTQFVPTRLPSASPAHACIHSHALERTPTTLFKSCIAQPGEYTNNSFIHSLFPAKRKDDSLTKRKGYLAEYAVAVLAINNLNIIPRISAVLKRIFFFFFFVRIKFGSFVPGNVRNCVIERHERSE